jgi:hypothetical protein
MADSGVVVTNDLARLIDAHNTLWEQFDASSAHAAKLRELAGNFPNFDSAPPIAALSSENTPPSELAASLNLVQRELKSAGEITAAINAQHEQIRKVKAQAQFILVSLVILAILVLVGGGAFLVSVLS